MVWKLVHQRRTTYPEVSKSIWELWRQQQGVQCYQEKMDDFKMRHLSSQMHWANGQCLFLSNTWLLKSFGLECLTLRTLLKTDSTLFFISCSRHPMSGFLCSTKQTQSEIFLVLSYKTSSGVGIQSGTQGLAFIPKLPQTFQRDLH